MYEKCVNYKESVNKNINYEYILYNLYIIISIYYINFCKKNIK